MLLYQVLVADRDIVVNASDGFGKDCSDRDDCNLLAPLGVRDRVRENHFAKAAIANALSGRVAHDGVRCQSSYGASAVFLHQVGCLADGAGSIYHIVDEDNVLVLYVADDGHAFYHVSLSALLVAKHKRSAEELSVAVGTLSAANVGLSYNQVLKLKRLDVRNKYRRSVKVVNRNVEETLNLVGV